MHEYRTIEGESTYELVEKKSRFIARLCHVDSENEALDFLAAVRKEHSQARHNVYAYILKGGRARYSDDGEPAQTSGLPTYETLSHADLVDAICVTTRYFGGTLLGTGGLVRAYTQACRGAIEKARIIRVQMCKDARIEIQYDLYNTVERICVLSGANIVDTDFSDKVVIVARIAAEDAEGLVDALTDSTNARARISLGQDFEGVLG